MKRSWAARERGLGSGSGLDGGFWGLSLRGRGRGGASRSSEEAEEDEGEGSRRLRPGLVGCREDEEGAALLLNEAFDLRRSTSGLESPFAARVLDCMPCRPVREVRFFFASGAMRPCKDVPTQGVLSASSSSESKFPLSSL